jgi:hypothetical protein
MQSVCCSPGAVMTEYACKFKKTARRRSWGWPALLTVVLLSGCAQWSGKQDAAKLIGIKYPAALSLAELDRLPLAEKVRYFTDNVYLAAEGGQEAGKSRAAAAAAVLDHLRKSLDKQSFVSLWVGVDPEFFGRVNAVLPYTDYTHPQVALNERQSRTAYHLKPRYLEVLPNLAKTRREAMQDLIDLAEQGDNAACFAFHKAYKDYADPLHGEPGVDWLDMEGKPFRKSSMWAGSGEAAYKGRVVQIAIPPQAVLGCRRILHPTDQVSAGVLLEVEQFFAAINLDGGFDPDTYTRHKETWLRELRDKATAAAQRARLRRIRVINVVDVYRIFPPALDYEYELAVADGTLPEMVASGILSEEQAFAVEERIFERRVLLTGVGATPDKTPMAYLKLVADRPVRNK